MIKKRGKAVMFVFFCLFAAISIRVAFLALKADTTRAATAQGSYTLTVDCPRGTIYGRNLEHITNHKEIYKAALTPTPEVMAAIYESFDKQTAEDIAEQLRSGKPVVTVVPAGFAAKGAKVFKCYDAVPDQQPAVQLVGYLDAALEKGVCGLQNVFDSLLCPAGKTKVTYSCDATGGVLLGIDPEIEMDMSQYEKGIVTTLDLEIQNICEQALSSVAKGAVVITKTGSGEILAMASAPTFSPDNMEAALKNENAPFVNRCLSEYNLGSIFKICVAAAALENGIATDFSYTCTGSISCGNAFGCHKKEGHGQLDMKQAFANSCNTYFIDLAMQVGADKIYDMAAKLGLGTENHLCEGISGAAGGLGDIEELRAVPAALANLSLGQGKVMVTPLQISALINAVADGGVYFEPYLISGSIDAGGNRNYERASSGRRVMSVATADQLKEMMGLVISQGTGVAAAPAEGVCGGKTATAETGWTDTAGNPGTNAWFAGFYELGEKRYSISVLAEGGNSGSASAAPVFQSICNGIAKLQTKE